MVYINDIKINEEIMRIATDPHTVFIRIVAAATINFSLTGVRLLIEGGSYLRAAS